MKEQMAEFELIAKKINIVGWCKVLHKVCLELSCTRLAQGEQRTISEDEWRRLFTCTCVFGPLDLIDMDVLKDVPLDLQLPTLADFGYFNISRTVDKTSLDAVEWPRAEYAMNEIAGFVTHVCADDAADSLDLNVVLRALWAVWMASFETVLFEWPTEKLPVSSKGT
eukprot:gene27085-33760_t